MTVPLGDPSLIIEGIEQGTPEWLRLRLGHATGSRQKDVIGWKYPKPTKANPEPEPEEKADRIMYRKEQVSERLIGELGQKQVFVNEAMRWGTMNEDIARQQYQLRYKRRVRQVTIIKHPTLRAAYSPDGLVGDDGLIEIKCLEPWNHLYEVVKRNEMPEQFKAQVQMGLWISNREWCDFIAYDSRQPIGLDLFSVRVERDEDYINMLAFENERFLAEVDAEVKHFMRYLPVVERTCKECGVLFTDKLSICESCGANNSVMGKIVSPAEFSLNNIGVDDVQKEKA